MGLMVQASPEPQIAAPAPQAPAAGDAAQPDAFQALLAALLGQASSTSAETPATAAELPAPVAKDENDDAKSAAVIEAMAGLQPAILPQAPAVEVGATEPQATESPVTGIGGEPQKDEPPAGATTDSEGVGEPAANAPAAAGTAPATAGTAPAAAGNAPAAALDSAPSAQPRSEAASQLNGFEAILDARSQKLERPEKREKHEPDGAAAPPGEPPAPESPSARSVVRSVGNADENKAEDHSNAFGRPDQKPQPKASVEGIAHSSENSVLHRTESASVSAPEAAPQPARAEVPETVQQLARTVIERVEAGGGEAKLHLHPADLGEITIHVEANGDHVRVHIQAEHPEAAQLIREHTVDLSSMLGQQGLNLADVNVSLGNNNSGNARDGQQAAPNRPADSDFAALTGIGDTATTGRFNRVRAAYNPDGAYDYRI